MALILARRKRAALYLSLCGLILMVAAVTALSARDPDGLWLRLGEVMIAIGVAMWLPWRWLAPGALAIWAFTNVLRSSVDGTELIRPESLAELPGLIGLTVFACLTRRALQELEDDDFMIGASNDDFAGIDAETGVYGERLLRPALEAELARSRRFGRECALVLTAIEDRYERDDAQNREEWTQSLVATAGLLRSTRSHIDRVYRYGETGFALLLPECGAREVSGMVRRLRRVARAAEPPEGEPAGPLPICFGATFFPSCSTSTEDMLHRASVALSLANQSATRLQLDDGSAPELTPATFQRKDASPRDSEGLTAPAITGPFEPAETTFESIESDSADDTAHAPAKTAIETRIPVALEAAPTRTAMARMGRGSVEGIAGRISQVREDLDRAEALSRAGGEKSLWAFDLESDIPLNGAPSPPDPISAPVGSRRAPSPEGAPTAAESLAPLELTPDLAPFEALVEGGVEPIDVSEIAAVATVEELIEALEIPLSGGEIEELGAPSDDPVAPPDQPEALSEAETPSEASDPIDASPLVEALFDDEPPYAESGPAAMDEHAQETMEPETESSAVPASDGEPAEALEDGELEIEPAKAEEVEAEAQGPAFEEPAPETTATDTPALDDMSELRRRLSETMGVIRTLKTD